MLLFFADLGIPLKYVDQRLNLEHYQLLTDAGRALYGTLPTVILQSVTFTMPAIPQNGLILSVKAVMTSVVAAGLQSLKVNGEVMYFVLKQKDMLLGSFGNCFLPENLSESRCSCIWAGGGVIEGCVRGEKKNKRKDYAFRRQSCLK